MHDHLDDQTSGAHDLSGQAERLAARAERRRGGIDRTGEKPPVQLPPSDHVLMPESARAAALEQLDSVEQGGPVSPGGLGRRGTRQLSIQRTTRRASEVDPNLAALRRGEASRPDPIKQSLMLLLTMVAMLVAARFAVPSVVEEIRYAWHRGELRAEYETGTEGLRNISLDALSDAYQMVTAAVGPSVVHIEVERRIEDVDGQMAGWMAHAIPTSDQGSGVVVDKEGYILTNHHVIADGELIFVTLSDGRRVPAELVGDDKLTDLALLKVNSNRLIPIPWGDSDRCRVGSPVWAVGSPFGLDRTVTFGILSGKHRMVPVSTQYQDFMQSDVAVNPGNSGGPLVNARGKLVGINTAIVGDTYQGVSFSIPSNVAKQVYQRLRETGTVQRAWLGVALSKEVPDELHHGSNPRVRGALISSIADSNSPAAQAGLRSGDLVLKIDGTNVVDTGHLMRLIGSALAGSTVQLDIRRDNQPLEISVQLGKMPSRYAMR